MTKAGIAYPSLMGILPEQLKVDDPVRPIYFSVRNCHPLVSIVLHDGQSVYYVEPARSPDQKKHWMLPQEKAKYGTDGTWRSVIVRGLKEELGIEKRFMCIHEDELHRFENHLPSTRTDGVLKTKCLIFFAVQIPKGLRFRIKADEVRRVIPVTCRDYIEYGFAPCRVGKCIATAEALRKATQLKLFSGFNIGWSNAIGQVFQEPMVDC